MKKEVCYTKTDKKKKNHGRDRNEICKSIYAWSWLYAGAYCRSKGDRWKEQKNI